MKRLDHFDYEALAVREWWHLNEVLDVLTCLEMEIKGYFDFEEWSEVYMKLWNKYYWYITDLISDDTLLPCYTSEETWENASRDGGVPGHAWDTGTTCIEVRNIIAAISSNNKANIRLDILAKLLAGTPTKELVKLPTLEINAGDNIILDLDYDEPVSHIVTEKLKVSVSQYRFAKTTQSWDLKFERVELNGVKNLAGMAYIKVLLDNPGVPMSVIEIQARPNPEAIKGSAFCIEREFATENDADRHSGQMVRNGESKAKSMANLRQRLLELLQERTELNSDYDYIGLESIDEEVELIEREIDRLRSSKEDDPEVKRNRDKVKKNIKDALKNIKELEMKAGFTDAPLFKYLNGHIKTGNKCEYTPPMINPPQWSFY
ncbi:hypothetical protein KP001_07875 [Geomonas subterranea]|uniref:Uncharacterized protein n=1 Tax=Geomonas subterranea TaxID=2847989 RepID=A0ABX8LNB7_9BACT|nr:hypothetical protein [Geomonas subterranea]QXE92431.1 hypothetical protein KP001_07875 [Geomonas subterranea]QXM09470.1 hypothetical protein KP002_21395 [Geomonas subterranea]